MKIEWSAARAAEFMLPAAYDYYYFYSSFFCVKAATHRGRKRKEQRGIEKTDGEGKNSRRGVSFLEAPLLCISLRLSRSVSLKGTPKTKGKGKDGNALTRRRGAKLMTLLRTLRSYGSRCLLLSYSSFNVVL